MDIERRLYKFEIELLNRASASSSPIIKVIAECIAKFLFHNLQVKLLINKQRYDYRYNPPSHEMLPGTLREYGDKFPFIFRRRLKNREFKHHEDEQFPAYYCLPSPYFTICYNLKKSNSFLFSMSGKTSKENKEIVESFLKNSYVVSRFVNLINALVSQRNLGDITFKIYQFTQKREQKLSLENLDRCRALLFDLVTLPISNRRTTLIDFLVIFLYNSSIVDYRRADISKNTVKGKKRLDIILEILNLSREALEKTIDLSPEKSELCYCLLKLIKTMYVMQTDQLSEDSQFENQKLVASREISFVEKQLLEINKKHLLYLYGKENLYQLTMLLVESNKLIFSSTIENSKSKLRVFISCIQRFIPKIVYFYNREYLEQLKQGPKGHESKLIQSNENRFVLNRHLLRLMFVYHAFTSRRAYTLIDSMTCHENNKFATSLAYVIHETLRYLGLKETPFVTRPMHFASCMLDIICVHAEKIHNVKLPSTLIRKLFESTSQKVISKQQPQLEKIEHVLNLYVGAFVIGKVTVISAPSDLLSLISNNKLSLLNNAVEKSNTDSFKQCLILSTLFHDFNMISELKPNSDDYRSSLDKLFDLDIINKIEYHDLLTANVHQNFHSVTGGHLLLETLLDQNSKYKNTNNVCNSIGERYILDRETIIKPTIRAVLFHNASYNISQIGKSQEPLITYLSLLDEIFDWEPSFNYDPQPTKSTLVYDDFSIAAMQQQRISPELGLVLEGVKWRSHNLLRSYFNTINDFKQFSATTKNIKSFSIEMFKSCLDNQYIDLPTHYPLLSFSINLASSTHQINEAVVKGTRLKFPHFSLYLGKNRYAVHKMHSALLKKSQSFGRFHDMTLDFQLNEEIVLGIDWEPRICANYVGEFFEATRIVNNIDKLMLKIDGDIASLVHDYILKLLKQVEINDRGILIGDCKNPFANLDIRDYFHELEEYILDRYENDKVLNLW